MGSNPPNNSNVDGRLEAADAEFKSACRLEPLVSRMRRFVFDSIAPLYSSGTNSKISSKQKRRTSSLSWFAIDCSLAGICSIS
ncbi:MAG: hypothetical protein F6K28_03160 [Microcoleus sp. SIO2G3]|nr:hypothetical protein [Microcoleus sp. SIO2G3]